MDMKIEHAAKAVSLSKVEVSYGSVQVIRELDLDIEPGEFLVLLGPSGCGKSTLLNVVAGLCDVTEGEVWIGNTNATWLEPKDRDIGMVFQSYALYPQMTVRGNLSFGLKMTGTNKAEISRRVKDAAEILQLTQLLDRKPRQLSGGQRQRVAIGRALVRQASVFLFDEPLSNLDAKLRTELRGELKRLHKQIGATMIFVTHDQIEALTLANRIAVMNGGVIQQIGSPSEVYRNPASKFVAGFIGLPGINFFEGTLEKMATGPVFKGRGFELLTEGYSFVSDPVYNVPVTLGIRPEHVATDSEIGKLERRCTAVDLIEPMGPENLVWGQLGNDPLSARIDSRRISETAQSLDFAIDPTLVSLFDAGNGQRI